MDIQLGTSLPSTDGSTAARPAPLPATSGPRETATPPAPTQTQAAAPAQLPLSSDALKQVANQINDFLKGLSSSLEFAVDNESKTVVVRVVDSQTQLLIRQMPSEEMLAISHSLDKMAGLLIKQKA